MLGRFEEAEMSIRIRERIAKSPETDVSRALLASIYGHQGRLEEAKAARAADVNPDNSLKRRRAMLPSAEFELLASGLRKAGLVNP